MRAFDSVVRAICKSLGENGAVPSTWEMATYIRSQEFETNLLSSERLFLLRALLMGGFYDNMLVGTCKFKGEYSEVASRTLRLGGVHYSLQSKEALTVALQAIGRVEDVVVNSAENHVLVTFAPSPEEEKTLLGSNRTWAGAYGNGSSNQYQYQEYTPGGAAANQYGLSPYGTSSTWSAPGSSGGATWAPPPPSYPQPLSSRPATSTSTILYADEDELGRFRGLSSSVKSVLNARGHTGLSQSCVSGIYISLCILPVLPTKKKKKWRKQPFFYLVAMRSSFLPYEKQNETQIQRN